MASPDKTPLTWHASGWGGSIKRGERVMAYVQINDGTFDVRALLEAEAEVVRLQQRLNDEHKAVGRWMGRTQVERNRVERLREALRQVDYFGEALIAREYEAGSTTIRNLVRDARAALVASPDKPPEPVTNQAETDSSK